MTRLFLGKEVTHPFLLKSQSFSEVLRFRIAEPISPSPLDHNWSGVEPGMFRSLSARCACSAPLNQNSAQLNAILPTLRPKGGRSSREYLNTVSRSLSVQACCVVSHRKTTDLVKESGWPGGGGHEPRQGLRS
jgi:hypothetical protein